MANNYRVKVRVEIEECADTTTDGPRKEGVGAFEWVISADQAQSIDECEQIVLQTDYEALRDALAYHTQHRFSAICAGGRGVAGGVPGEAVSGRW